jgi:hemin uptake protein HemP
MEAQSDAAADASHAGVPTLSTVARIKSEDLLRQARELEIDHQGRIYRLRLTQSNKLILTA